MVGRLERDREQTEAVREPAADDRDDEHGQADLPSLPVPLYGYFHFLPFRGELFHQHLTHGEALLYGFRCFLHGWDLE